MPDQSRRSHGGPMRTMSFAPTAGVVLCLMLSPSCGVTRGDDSRDMLMIIPNSPGGGYDQTGRAAVQVMEDEDITGGSFTVDNVIGPGGPGRWQRSAGQA